MRSLHRIFDASLRTEFFWTARHFFLKVAAQPAAMASFKVDEVTIHVVGDIGIIQARTPYKRLNGLAGVNRYTDIYVKRDGRWQALSATVTPVK